MLVLSAETIRVVSKEYMSENDMTQTTFAERAGLRQSTVSPFLNGTHEDTTIGTAISLLKASCKYLHVTDSSTLDEEKKGIDSENERRILFNEITDAFMEEMKAYKAIPLEDRPKFDEETQRSIIATSTKRVLKL